MRGLVFWGAVFSISTSCFGQLAKGEINYYTYAGLSHTAIVLGSAENRTGSGFSFAAGKIEPKLLLFKRVPGELVWEAFYNESHTNKPSARYPSRTNQTFAINVTARYRWLQNSRLNFYTDGGLGFALLRHRSKDLPLANDFMIGGGVGAEFLTSDKTSFMVGTRYIHTSNAGRKKPNYGENLFQYYVGYCWKK